MEMTFDQSITFHRMLPEQRYFLRLSTPTEVCNRIRNRKTGQVDGEKSSTGVLVFHIF